MEAELVYNAKAKLGEGPVWDHERNRLIWVDIEECKVHFLDPASGQDKFLNVGTRISVAVPNFEGRIIGTLQDGFAWIMENGDPVYISDPERNMKRNRFNDGKCDPQGRLWAGTMHMDVKENAGGLYRMNENLGVAPVIVGVSISNGLAWSSDSSTMYYIDTLTYRVDAYEFDRDRGTIANPRTVVEIPDSHGAPDGMTIDTEDRLWIAHWGGGNVSCWDPDTGKLEEVITVPAPQPTSCVFGGPELDTLYITSARIGMSPEQMDEFPLSGGIFAVKPGVKGTESNYFKGKFK